MKESRTDRLAGVDGNHRGPAVRVSEKVVTPFRTNDLEAGALKDGEDLLTGRPREACHNATVTR
jgi:hypothetical protein